MFGGNDMNQSRLRMRELHSRIAEVNEKYGQERGDDITITHAKHKSTETYRRELADECRTLSNEVGIKKTLLSGLNRSIIKAEIKFKALQTMVSNLEKTEAEKQATIAELEDYMKNHIGDAIEIKAKITATRKIADIYPRMTSTHDSSLFDDSFAMDLINHGDKIIYCAMYLYIDYIN